MISGAINVIDADEIRLLKRTVRDALPLPDGSYLSVKLRYYSVPLVSDAPETTSGRS